MNSVLKEDIEWIIENNTVIDRVKSKTILVTGATGLIGAQVVKTLGYYNEKYDASINAVAMVRSEEKAREVFSDMGESAGIQYYVGDISNPICLDTEVDYIIHGASATDSKYFVSNPVETIWTAVNGTKNILDFAGRQKIKGLVYLSSLEVYGAMRHQGLVKEGDYGYIDPLSVRSSYSEGKRMTECLCVSYAKEYDIPVKIARLSQTFGPGVNYHDGRVFAEFARCALEKKDIILHTAGRTVRSYCYTRDAVNAIIYILLKGNTGEAYNVTNMDTEVSIREMAQMVCNTIGNSEIQVKIDEAEDISFFGYNPEMVIKLSSEKLNGLGWKASMGLEEMYERMVKGYVSQ